MSLPSEIQTLILMHFLRQDNGVNLTVGDGPLENLSDVCFLWRDLIEDVPQFWSAFSLRLTDQIDSETLIQSCSEIYKRLQLYLSRSKDTKLSICLQINSDNSACEEVKQLSLRITTLLKSPSHVNRWQDMELACTATFATKLLKLDDSLSPAGPLSLTLILPEAPYDVPPDFTIQSLLVPFSATLNELSLNTRLVDLKTCLEILAQFPKLHRYKAVIHCESDFNVSPGLQPACRLEHLDLELQKISPVQASVEHPLQDLAQLMEAVTLGELTSLRIHWASSTSPDGEGGRALSATFSKCTKLRNLAIINLPLDQDGFDACIGALTDLRRLSISYPDPQFPSPISRNFFRALCGHEGTMQFPQLEMLDISIHSDNAGKKNIHELLERRTKARGCHALKELSVQCDMNCQRDSCTAWQQELSATYPSLTVNIYQ
ncbi:hypothetical protein EV714DRAFT_282403 [Schizophyllum commune]